jgi:predicted acylesterase/phospholipase RssA
MPLSGKPTYQAQSRKIVIRIVLMSLTASKVLFMRPKIGVALGSGAARGWAQIGVFEGLAALGVVPQIVSGTSIGALVGAAFV